MAAASFAKFDAAAPVEPAGGLRQEALGRLSHQAPPEAGFAAADSLWDELKNRRILFTPSSALLLGGVLDTLLLALGSAPPATGVSTVRCQYTSGVLALATESFGGFPVGELHAMKSGLRDHRLLIIVAETNAASDDQASVRTSVAMKLAGITEVDHLPAVAAAAKSFEELLSKLNAFLIWLRTALGTFRAKLPTTTGSPSVVGRLRFIAAERSFHLEPAAAGSSDIPLLVPPSAIRRMMAPAPAAGAPIPSAAAAAEGAGSAPVGEKRSRAAYEAQHGAGAAGAAVPHGSSSGRSSAAAGPIAAPSERVSLAIIVPYRNQPLQNREPQLLRFAEAMPRFLAAVLPPLADFHIFIVEQSEDGYKFNRGKTLNIGFALATDPHRAAKYGVKGDFNAVCFHDVDLLPQPRIGEWYSRYPSRPLHIGGAWPRYARDNETYVGGITTLSTADFQRINGFPNNFWGWGGEDDELRDRLQVAGLFPPLRPDPSFYGSIVDLEEELKVERGGERASTKLSEGGRQEWRCMWRKELRAYHVLTGHRNGLSTLHFKLLDQRALNDRTTVFTVDLCGEADVAAQMDGAENNGVKVSAATVRGFVDEMMKLETGPGTGQLKHALAAAGSGRSAGGGAAAAVVGGPSAAGAGMASSSAAGRTGASTAGP